MLNVAKQQLQSNSSKKLAKSVTTSYKVKVAKTINKS